VLPSVDPFPQLAPFGETPILGPIFTQYLLTYVAFLVLVPLGWWVLFRTNFGLAIRSVGENPEAADAAGINVFRTRYVALMIGGALMAVGGAFLSLAALGAFSPGIIAGCWARCSSAASLPCNCACKPLASTCPSRRCWPCPTW
jgi:simple sugar transport system permease protein